MVRGSSLSHYSELVAELGCDPTAQLRAAGIPLQDVGVYDAFISFPAAVQAVESAARVTGTTDFGRQLALRQGIEILGAVGVAARTAPTLTDGLAIFTRFMTAYSRAVSTRVSQLGDPSWVFFSIELGVDALPPCPQTYELALGVSLRVLRVLLGPDYSPSSVHVPHDALSPVAEYRRYFGCRPCFAAPIAGFTMPADDLRRPLPSDAVEHRVVVDYLSGVIGGESELAGSVSAIARQLLPTGAATLETVALQLNLHPKSLQRKLAAEGTTFAEIIDRVRMEAARRYLLTTRISLSQLAHQLGYADQSVLTRSCGRWFGCAPTVYRKRADEVIAKNPIPPPAPQ